MRRRAIFMSTLIISLITLGMFFVYGLCQESNTKREIEVNQGDEASVSSPLAPTEEIIAEEREKAQETDKGVFRIGGNDIKLLLVQPQPIFSSELLSLPEDEAEKPR